MPWVENSARRLYVEERKVQRDHELGFPPISADCVILRRIRTNAHFPAANPRGAQRGCCGLHDDGRTVKSFVNARQGRREPQFCVVPFFVLPRGLSEPLADTCLPAVALLCVFSDIMDASVRQHVAGIIPGLRRSKWKVLAAAPLVVIIWLRFVVASWLLEQGSLTVRTLMTAPVPEKQWNDPNFWTGCVVQ